MLAEKLAMHLSQQLGRRFEQNMQLPATAAWLQSFLSPCPCSPCQCYFRSFFTLLEHEPEPISLALSKRLCRPGRSLLPIWNWGEATGMRISQHGWESPWELDW